MTAIVSGNSLGLGLTSLGNLGLGGVFGNPAQGRSGEQAYVNIATGNLVLQNRDDVLMSRGDDVRSVRTYNSLGLLDDDNGDNWGLGSRLVQLQRVDASTLVRIDSDGSRATYTLGSVANQYINRDGGGAFDAIVGTEATGFQWTDGSSRRTATYSGTFQLTSSSDGQGNNLTYVYSGALLTSVTSASGETTYYDYTGNQLTRIRQVLSGGAEVTRVRYTYDSSNRLSSVTVDLTPADNSTVDGASYRTDYEYDGTSKRVSKVTQKTGSGAEITLHQYTYALVGGDYRIASMTDPLGSVISFSYDTAARRTTVTDAQGRATSYDYDSAGQLIAVTQPAVSGVSFVTSYVYDAAGNLTKTIDGSGRVVDMAYDAQGNQTLQRDGAGNTVTRTYDGNNQLSSETVYLVPDPDGSGSALPSSPLVTRYVYQAGRPTQLRYVISPEGRVTENVYAPTGERTATLRYGGSAYAAGSSVPAEADMNSWKPGHAIVEKTTMDYDVRGQLVKVSIFAAGTDSTAMSQTTYVYDAFGRLLQTVDGGGSSTAYTYDGLDRVLTVTNALSQVTTTLYDDAGGLVKVTGADGTATTSTYDKAGRLTGVSATSPSAGHLGTRSYRYDLAGNLLMSTDPTGVRQWSLYDEAGRKVADVDATGSLTEYEYDAAGRLTHTRAYATAVDTAALANHGMPTPVALSTIRPATSSSDRQGWQTYDVAGRLVKTVNAVGAVTELSYDGAGRVVRTTQYATAITITSLGSTPTAASIAPVASATADRVARNFYSNDGLLLGTLDAEGYLTENTYDPAGRLFKTTRYATLTGSANWASGTLDSLRPLADATRDQTAYRLYDSAGRLTGLIDAEGYLTATVYNARGTVASATRYANKVSAANLSAMSPDKTVANILPTVSATSDRITAYSYDALGRLAQETSPEGVITTRAYDTAGNLVKVIRASGTTDQSESQTRYDWLGRVTAELSPVGAALLTTSMTSAEVEAIWAQYAVDHAYDLAGRRISTTDANGYKTLYFYDADGHLTHTVNPLGEVEERQYNAFGQLSASIRYGTRISVAQLTGGLVSTTLSNALAAVANVALDAKTTYTYKLTGAVSTAKDALGFNTTHSYNSFGDLASRAITIAAGVTRTDTFSVDRRGLVIGTVQDSGGLGTTASVSYDAFGRTVTATDAKGNVSGTSYDRLGRVVQVTDPSSKTHKATYDAFDRVLTRTDALGKVTAYAYDKAVRTMTVTTPEGIVVVTTYTRLGQVLSVKDGRGNTATYTYDDNGNLTKTVAGGVSITQAYDAGNRLIETTDGRGVKTVFTYDSANRTLTRKIDPLDATTNPDGLSLTTTYTWDALGRKLTAKESDGIVTSYEYDLEGRVLRQIANPTGLALTTVYTYDAEDRVLTVTDAGGTVTQYTYDKLGRRTLEQVDPAGLNLTRSYAYDDKGNLVRVTDARGYYTRYEYDANDRLTYTINPLGQVTLSQYDAEGRITSVKRYADTVTTAETGSAVVAGGDPLTRYLYDDDGRLRFTVNASGAVTRNEYDANGNLITQTQHADRITASEQPTAVVAGASDRVTRYVYDTLNRETWRSDPTGAVTRTYYDNNGNVTSRRLYATLVPGASPDTAVTSTSDRLTRMTYDAANRLAYAADPLGYVTGYTYDGVGRVKTTTRYATAISSSTAPSAVTTSGADRVETLGYDAAGRVTLATDALGFTETYTYDETGNKLSFTNKNGDVWTYTYDAADRLLTEKSPAVPLMAASVDETTGKVVLGATSSAQITTRFTYDAMGNLLTRTEADGRAGEARTTSYAYDSLGRQVKTTYPTVDVYAESSTDRTANTRLGSAARDETAKSTSVLTYYDSLGNAVASIDRAGTISYKSYDLAGRVVYEVDALGFVTYYYRNAFGETASVTRYANATTLNTVAAADADTEVTVAKVSAQVNAAGIDHTSDRKLTNYYDLAGRVIKVVESVAFTYEAATAENDSAGAKTTKTAYNAFGEATLVSQLLHRVDDVWVDTWHYFDRSGREVATVDELGYLTTRIFDQAGNLISQTAYATAMTSGTWDADSYTAPAAHANDRSTTFVYDKGNRKTSETRLDVEYSTSANGATVRGNLTTSYGYDAVSNLTRTTDAAGGVTYSYYDALGRVKGVIAPARTSTDDGSSLAPLIEFRRDAHGNVVAKIERAESPASYSATSFTATTSSADRTTKTDFDAAGHAVQVDDAAGLQHYYSYTASGQLAKSWQTVTDNDGLQTTLYTAYSYDKLGRVLSIYTPGTTAGTAISTNHEYNGFGELVRKGINSGWQESFEYDNAGRLWRTTSGAEYGKVFLYDLLGRVTAEISNAGSGRSNASTVLSAANAAEAAGYTSVRRSNNKYDALGRLIAKYAPERQIKQGGVTIRAATANASVASSSSFFRGYDETTGLYFTWSGNNSATVSWTTLQYLGSGEVRVDLTYLTKDTRQQATDEYGNTYYIAGGSAPVSRTESQIFRGDQANTGATMSWVGTAGDQDAGRAGISSITALVVYKKNINGDWVKVIDRNPAAGRAFGTYGNIVEAGSPLDVSTTLTFKYKLSTATTWTTVGTSLFGDAHWWDASALAAGTYNYEVYLTKADGTAELSDSGSFTRGVTLDADDVAAETWQRPVEFLTVDRWGNVTSRSDPRNATWKTVYSYNANNQLVQESQPNPADGDQDSGSPIRYVYYDKLGRQLATRDARGYVNGTTYDAGGNLVTESHADGGKVTHFYDAFGERIRSIDALGNASGASTRTKEDHTTVFEYDKLGRLIATTHGIASAGAVGVWTSNVNSTWYQGIVEISGGTPFKNLKETYAYDEAGRKKSQKNAAGNETKYWYDAAGHVIKTRQPLGQETTANYNAYGHKVSETDGNGYTATWTYNYFGRLTDHNDLANIDFNYTYDTAGQLVAQISNHGQNLAYTYDAAGQLLQVKDTSLYNGTALNKFSTFSYDLSGRHLREKVSQGTEVLQDNHLAYDMLGRLRSSADNRVLITFEYDAEGNRTRVKTHVRVDAVGDDDVETLKDEDRYFTYDTMNRQLLVDGYADGTIGQRGHTLTYDLNGNRLTDTFWGNKVTTNGGQTIALGYDEWTGEMLYYDTPYTYTTSQANVTEKYSYDALGRLQATERDGVQVDLRLYDAASRVVQSGPKNKPLGYTAALNQGVPDADAIGLERRLYRYDANGRLLFQRTYASDGTTIKSDLDYEGTSRRDNATTLGYDGAGNVLAFDYSNYEADDDYINLTKITLARYEGYVETQRVTTSTMFQTGTSTSSYDANGYLVKIDDATQNTLDRTIANDASGRALRVTQSGNTLYSLLVNGEMFGRHGVGPDEVDPRTGEGAARFAQIAEFEFGYRSITGSYPAPSVGQYTVRQGDSLQGIAQAAYGDSRLWWKVAQANGLGSDRDLRVGQTLTLPTQVAGSSNNASTFKPYDPSEIVGDTSPNLPQPKGGDGCGALGVVLMIVVAVAVTVITAGAAAAAMGAGGGMTTWGAGAAALAGEFGATTAMAAGAVGAAAGSVASQAVGIAIGAQQDFSWKSVALSAIGGGVSGGLAGEFGKATLAGSELMKNIVVRAAVSNAMTQGIAVVTGLQRSFSWTSVAASAVGAGVGSAIGAAMGLNDAEFASRSPGEQFGARMFTGLAAGTATALARGGRVAVQQVAADAFGNALGESLADAMKPEPVAGAGLKLKPGTAENWGPKYSFDDPAPTLDYSLTTGGTPRLGGCAGEESMPELASAGARRGSVTVGDGSSPGDFAADVAARRGFVSPSATAQAPREFAQGEVTGEFSSTQRIDSRLLAFTPNGMTKVDGGPVTYSFDERTDKAYWNLGEENMLREIRAPYRVPTLDDARRAPGNPFAMLAHADDILSDFMLLGVGGGLGAAVTLPVVGLAARGVMGFAADASSYGLRTAYLMNAGGVNATGMLSAELTLGYDAASPSPMLFASGGRNVASERYLGLLGRNAEPLTASQITEARSYALQLGLPEDRLQFFTHGGAHQRSAYSDLFDTVFLGPDLMPSVGQGLAANSRVSARGLLAHEIVGHRDTTLAGRAFEAGSLYDEVQASWRAARLAPDLTGAERFTLLRDAVERVHTEGLRVRDLDKSKFWFGEAK